jgi:hypothetical protein
MNPKPKVTLLTWTQHPLETVFAVWWASKDEKILMDPAKLANYRTGQPTRGDVETLFKAVIAQRIPIGEHIDFVFVMENVSVSWREQAVRHRIGVEISPERIGVDIIPNLADSSFWSQSMRIQNMGEFARNGAYRLPDSIRGGDLEELYHKAMGQVEAMYRMLVEAGVPMEDARELIPLGAHHRISWKLNIGALQHIIGKRGCWILQLGIWGPVIMGMVEELVTKVHPIFRELVCPPCIKGDNFHECIYMEECRRRLDGSDQLPPCPLHLFQHELGIHPIDMDAAIDAANRAEVPMKFDMIVRAEQYRKFWGRNPYTGAKEK